MTANIPMRAIFPVLALAWMVVTADQASAMGSTRTGGQANRTGGQAGGTTQNFGAGTGAQAIGSNAPSGAVTGQIGRSSDRMLQDVGSNTGTGGLGGLGGFGGGRGFGGLGGLGGMNPFGMNPFGANNTARGKPAVRTRLVNGVDPLQPVAVSQPAITSQQQVFSAPVAKIVDGYSIAVADGTATLTGVVRSDRDRRMAELVLKLEPGINRVDNRIVVQP
jgi:hypothetical protein